MSGGILSGGILERGDIVRGDFVLGGYCPGGYCPGDIVRGDIVRGDIVLEPSITSCHFTKYRPRCKSCDYNGYNIKVFAENMGHLGPIEIVIIKRCPNLLRIYGKYVILYLICK